MRKIIITLLSIVLVTMLLASEKDLLKQFKKAKMKKHSGVLTKIGDTWHLAKDKKKGPELHIDIEDLEAYESLKWENGTEIELVGLTHKGKVLVTNIFTETDTIHIRDARGIKHTKETLAGQWKVIPKKCISCGLCVKLCPVDAVKMVKGKAVIDQSKCINCGNCAHGGIKGRGCPTSAIKK